MNGKQLKNSILQWAIQGKLVPQDPNDEPASVLLERIREEKAKLVKENKIKKNKNESIIYRGDDNSYYEKFLGTGEVKCIDDEIPFEIPNGWEWTRINTIAASQLGKTLNKGTDVGQEYPYLCSINVYWDGINLSKIKTFKLRNDELLKYRLDKGDLLICEGGDYGRCCVWDSDEEMYYQNALHRVRFYCGLSSTFYKYVFELYRNIEYIVGQGQTIKHFTYDSMKSILFPVPSISEQNRIVKLLKEILSLVTQYDKKQDALNSLNQQIKTRLQKSILQEAIQGKLVPQIAEEGTAEELIAEIRKEKEFLVKEEKLKKSALTDSIIYKGDDNKYWEKNGKNAKDLTDEIPFEIPDSWAWCRLSTLVLLLSGRDLEPSQYNSVSKGIPYMTGASNFKNGTLIKNRWTDVPIVISVLGDLLITCKGTIGEMAFNNIGDIHIARQIMALRSSFVDLNYIQYYLSANIQVLQRQANSMIPGISRDILLKALVPLPPLMEQNRIVAKIKQLTSIMSRLEISI